MPVCFSSRPENVPRLFDLIKVDDAKIANAFFFAVRNTLVANTLEQATRIAYGKVCVRQFLAVLHLKYMLYCS